MNKKIPDISRFSRSSHTPNLAPLGKQISDSESAFKNNDKTSKENLNLQSSWTTEVLSD